MNFASSQFSRRVLSLKPSLNGLEVLVKTPNQRDHGNANDNAAGSRCIFSIESCDSKVAGYPDRVHVRSSIAQPFGVSEKLILSSKRRPRDALLQQEEA